MVVQQSEESSEQERIADGLRRIVRPDACSLLQIALLQWSVLSGAIRTCAFALITHTSFSKSCVEIITICRFRRLLLLFLLQRRCIKLSVCGGRCVIAALGCFSVLWLLALFLLCKTLEEFGDLIDCLVCRR